MLRPRVPLPRLIGPAETIAGEGALAALHALPAARVALIATDRAYADPVVRRWLEMLLPYEVRRIRPSWRSEPSRAALEGTLGEVMDFKPDWIVAVGGGSVIDGARLCWALYEHPTFPLERLERPFGLPPLRALARFVAVPTTAGTGAECSSSAVLTDPDRGRKIPVVTHDFLPDVVILEPRLTMGLPLLWTTLTAFDALAHALEGRASRLANGLVDDLADSSAVAILRGLAEFHRSGESVELRSRLQTAAYYAGQVQNLRLVGLAHAVAHQLGNHSLPHSVAVSGLLPLSLARASATPEACVAYADIAKRSGLPSVEAMIDEIRRLAAAGGIPRGLGSWPGVGTLSALQAEKIAAAALDDPIARVLPFKIELRDLANSLAEAW